MVAQFQISIKQNDIVELVQENFDRKITQGFISKIISKYNEEGNYYYYYYSSGAAPPYTGYRELPNNYILSETHFIYNTLNDPLDIEQMDLYIQLSSAMSVFYLTQNCYYH